MDHKVVTYLVLLIMALHNISASKNGITLSVGENNEFTATCSLALDFQAPTTKPIRCEKGDRGIVGIIGLPGLRGEKGEVGLEGLPGLSGPPGDDVSGTAPMGDKGYRGLSGFYGDKGERGLEAECTPKLCDEDKNIGFGAEDFPAQVTCKFAPPGTESGEYFMGPVSKSFKVYCDMDKKETCIKGASRATLYEVHFLGWLSQFGVNMVEEEEYQNIRWLQERSSSARQVLTYLCGNLLSYDIYTNLRFLSWNDKIIVPRHKNESSLFYSINSSGCEEDVLGAVKIEIQSSKADSLPVIDVFSGKYIIEELTIYDNDICFG